MERLHFFKVIQTITTLLILFSSYFYHPTSGNLLVP